MQRVEFYQIEGVQPSSYVANVLGHPLRFSSKLEAIRKLEAAIEKWRSEPTFVMFREVVFEAAIDKSSGYHHQIIFKHKRDGLAIVYHFMIVKHFVLIQP